MRSAILVVCVLLGIRMRASGRWLTLACRNKSGSRVRPLTLSLDVGQFGFERGLLGVPCSSVQTWQASLP